jgi:hypothetical protein
MPIRLLLTVTTDTATEAIGEDRRWIDLWRDKAAPSLMAESFCCLASSAFLKLRPAADEGGL